MNEDSKTIENNLPTKGFASHPENINRNGRPTKGNAWAEIFEAVGNEIDDRTGKPFKELVSRKMWAKAVGGDINAAREIMDRMEGKPVSKTELTGKDGEQLFPEPIYGGKSKEL